MNRITYRYTNLAKQALILSLILYFIMRAIIMVQIVVYRLDGYYEATNVPLTILMYGAIFAVLILLLRSYTFCYAIYGKDKVTYYNRLLRREKSFSLTDARLAVFDSHGVKFFAEEHADPRKDRPLFFLPFFRGGIVEAISIDRFFRTLKDRDDILVVKTFQALPGYAGPWKILTIVYAFIAAVVFMNCSTPLTVIIVLFQSR